uniref:Uncharacterized protein n=1 Tax=Candidatus Kentrum sp. LPFa TaxID=2126335 RepID=A0A450Y3D8_9GAMM|nr:MAG: hypothetical protein BECKLPF1236A_GA0070988_104502 [Candidatus Kentron sp. LPFa]VFK36055.1 MAG: hypothetical protein BECKLPF1236C_GA0070990_104762 [Candidatus Kentron sp. LPFa]
MRPQTSMCVAKKSIICNVVDAHFPLAPTRQRTATDSHIGTWETRQTSNAVFTLKLYARYRIFHHQESFCVYIILLQKYLAYSTGTILLKIASYLQEMDVDQLLCQFPFHKYDKRL